MIKPVSNFHPDFEALAVAWQKFARAAEIPADYNGDSSSEAHAGVMRAQELLRDRITGANDYRLFPLLHILGNASLRMEQVLYPEDYARIEAAVKAALATAELDQSNWSSTEHTEVILATSLLRRD